MTNLLSRKQLLLWLIEEEMRQFIFRIALVIDVIFRMRSKKRKRSHQIESYNILQRIPDQVKHLNMMTMVSDIDCVLNLRMDRNAFGRLCNLMRQLGSLKDGKFVTVEEQLAMFLSVLAHHKKNRVVRFDFWRSGQTISRYIHTVLKAILKLHVLLLVKPDPVSGDNNDPRWKWFKGCLGALDGTYINVKVPNCDKARYRTRKGQISTNTLGVCDQNMRFVYALPGWEGSAADSRILRDALNRPYGLRVPKGNYYLVDNGYANSEGFLAPYKGVRYHLKEWGPSSARPQNAEELFNLRHTKARNVIERAFGIMKMRWGILRSTTYYPIQVQTRLIMACFLLHNFIRNEMAFDPIEQQYDTAINENDDVEIDHSHYIDSVEASQAWNAERDSLANAMWQQYLRGN
ncbi:protein ANTAGONIST OF LIKE HETEROCHROMATIN PROTEIN 1-like [Salvia miltiorrhiza]|uniref:protein ANTAGONIST OF LIKE HETEROCHROMATIN PROTEIN 1-like n=1 Tax=Salvia miltiorrhiza TaxID=226208 RepID=UPI0025AC9951|nr:protein ANTAGONIST OF LIKE HETEROCHROMATIN PROTEIN 1-like [Salvia miltiorrhiza]